MNNLFAIVFVLQHPTSVSFYYIIVTYIFSNQGIMQHYIFKLFFSLLRYYTLKSLSNYSQCKYVFYLDDITMIRYIFHSMGFHAFNPCNNILNINQFYIILYYWCAVERFGEEIQHWSCKGSTMCSTILNFIIFNLIERFVYIFQLNMIIS